MARDIGRENLAEAQRNGAYPVDFVRLEVTPPENAGNPQDYTLRLSTLYTPVRFQAPDRSDSETFEGAGHLLSVGRVSESLDVKQNSIDITLSGLDIAVTRIIVGTNFIGSPITIYRGFYDENVGDVVSAPYIVWRGFTNDYSTMFSGDIGQANDVAVNVSCRNLLVSILETQAGRYTSPSNTASAAFYEHVAYTASFNPSFGRED